MSVARTTRRQSGAVKKVSYTETPDSGDEDVDMYDDGDTGKVEPIFLVLAAV
jgi:hypothetical protein